MKCLGLASFLSVAVAVIATPVESEAHKLRRQDVPQQGIDVSQHQSNIDWDAVRNKGVSFVYIKATTGDTFKSPAFASQYTGATNAGLIRGAYHVAFPDTSSGATQAKHFVSNGGDWSSDGRTMPGALDIEDNPNGSDRCYGLSSTAMVNWIRDFSETYNSLTGRYPVIYTTTNWWKQCTKDDPGFGPSNPLWIAHYASSVGVLPAGWQSHTFWQYSDSGPNGPGNQDSFNGDLAQLQRFVRG
ncbi:putative N,O-diacetyl muramidase [Panaeolus papilionaceus]|nr:putative N,O-diacetyl muramidase [Panaeolus papilionaceus]